MGVNATGGIKSIQRGVLNMGATGTATATITAVNTAKSELRFLGSYSSNGGTNLGDIMRIELTNSTTITGTRSGTGTGICAWEVTEWY